MKRIQFNFKIKIKTQPKKRRWVVVICTNRSINFKPIVLVNTKKIINLIGSIEGFSNYLNLKRNNKENAIIYFYSYIEDKNNQMQVNKCKKYKLLNLLTKSQIKIDFGKIVLMLTNLTKQPKTSITRFSYKNLEVNLNDYIQKINEKLLRTFKIEKNETWNVIYYTLDTFQNSPIVTSILMDNEESNELFWINLYNCVKKIFMGYGIKWNPEVCWVNLFTAINNFSHNYVLENKDLYMESWFMRGFDCDESIMPYQLYTLFNKCTFLNAELKLMQSYSRNQYIAFTSFMYVSSPSASMVKTSNNFLGHWVLLLYLRSFFYEHCIDLKFTNNKNFRKDLPKCLYGETTAPLYPNDIKPLNLKGIGDRKMRFLRNSNFFKRINTLTTVEFLKIGIPGFYCGIRTKGGILKYGIPFNLSNLKKIVFVSFPKIGKNILNFAKECADERIPIPKLLCFFTKKNSKIKHYECFVTNEKIKDKIKNIITFFRNNFKCKEYLIHKYFLVFSLDQLMDIKIRKKLLTQFGRNNAEISVDVYELMYNSYTFTIKII